jgi:glycosyltransferase involved in cell wall biosynthesis
MKVLTFMDWYLPAFRAGGPIRTMANLIGQLADEVEFLVVTRDRDLGEDRPFDGIAPRAWTEVSRAQVCYLTPAQQGLVAIAGICRRTPHDLVYLNSLFSRFTLAYLVARLFRIVPRTPVLIAPRGECAPAALRIRSGRKKAYLAVMSGLHAFDNITWQASADHEREHIELLLTSCGMLHRTNGVLIAPDLLERPGDSSFPVSAKRAGTCRFVFVSRVSPMKNLCAAVRLLDAAGENATLDIFGPIEDEAYWAECRQEIEKRGLRERAQYRGVAKPDEVAGILGAHDFLLLPTLGENFGHVIAEALLAGTPVILSDRTSWTAVDSLGAGWCIRLDDDERWRETLAACIGMDAQAHEKMRNAARALGALRAISTEAVEANRALFISASSRGAPVSSELWNERG